MIFETLVTTGFAAMIASIGYLYKDHRGKAQNEATLQSTLSATSNEIINRLRTENSDLRTMNKNLLTMYEEKDKKCTDMQKDVQAMEIQVKELSLEVQRLKIQKL